MVLRWNGDGKMEPDMTTAKVTREETPKPDMIQAHITREEVQEPEPIKVNVITQKPKIKQVKVKVTYPEGRIKHFHPNIKFTGP